MNDKFDDAYLLSKFPGLVLGIDPGMGKTNWFHEYTRHHTDYSLYHEQMLRWQNISKPNLDEITNLTGI